MSVSQASTKKSSMPAAPGHAAGDLQARLDRLAAKVGERNDEAGDEDAERIEPAEERHDDGREAIAGRDHRLQLADDAGHFHDAGEPGESSGDRKGEDCHALGGEAGKGAGARALSPARGSRSPSACAP
jgi:hypothetical protein